MREVKEKSPLKERTVKTLKSAPQTAFRRGTDASFEQLRQELRDAAQDGQPEDRYESGKITDTADHAVQEVRHLAEKAAHRLPKTKCLNCGKEIRTERANRPRKFCSIECKNEMRLKNSNPRYVKWQKIRAAIKAEHGQCTKCGATENLHVHHIDHDTKNNDVENLIVLCQSCHIKYHRLHDYQAMTFEQFMTLK